VIEVLLDQMLAVVFPQDFNLAPKVVIGTLDELVLTHVSVLLDVLPQDLGATFVVTVNDFEQTSLVVRLKILEHDYRGAFLIRTHDAAEDTV